MWFADVEATLPRAKFPTPTPTDSEERFGKLKFGVDWVGQLKTDELTILEHLRPQWEGYLDVSGNRVDPGRTQWRYDGPEELVPMAEKVKERAARGNEQVAYVRRGLKLLKSFGRGDAPPLGSPYRYAFDPLDPVAEIDPNDRALLIEFRLFYWSDRADNAAFEAPVEAPMRSESTFETTLARSGSVTGGKQGRGPKPVYDREFVRKLVFDLMEEHGEFFAGDPDWGSQVDLEREMQAAFQEALGVEPATSTIRKLIAEPLEDWRRRKVTADN